MAHMPSMWYNVVVVGAAGCLVAGLACRLLLAQAAKLSCIGVAWGVGINLDGVIFVPWHTNNTLSSIVIRHLKGGGLQSIRMHLCT